eukprot:CAMPEP_0114662094 /NCGR_PEP_ID=MMETSP0191-20121206/24073_1 /TAXON_ID=126664 /ORGANISM="Sorites sp." /LENGTH=362 /DNA_ID=CAMNT_0001897111 /DNA_START=24 /DNA_END=1113 /DNA_ORIENTATION=+
MPLPNKKKKGKGKGKGKGKQKPNNKSKPKSKKPKQKKKNNNNSDEKKDEYNDLDMQGINLVSVDDYKLSGQTYPPSLTVKNIFESNQKQYPINELLRHPGDKNKYRWESDEKKAIENELKWQIKLQSMREAAEVHRQTRQAAQNYIKPGMSMTEICNFIEGTSSKLVGFDMSKPKLRGWGFPTGCSLNDCAAHYTPNPGDKIRLKPKDLCKIDFGVQINGYIIDSAFSMSFDPMHDELMKAVKAATNRGVEVMGIDARLGEIGGEIQEVMESFECVYDGKTYPVKCIRNLNGHSIGPWEIHAGKTVPIVKSNDQTKMEEGELFAIETFGSTGKGFVDQMGECSHFALIKDHDKPIMVDQKVQ